MTAYNKRVEIEKQHKWYYARKPPSIFAIGLKEGPVCSKCLLGWKACKCGFGFSLHDMAKAGLGELPIKERIVAYNKRVAAYNKRRKNNG